MNLSLKNLPFVYLRFGLAFVFTFAAVSMSLNPSVFAHYIPPFITAIMPYELFLHLFGAYEIILSLILISGKFGLISSFLATATMFALTVSNTESFNVLFRNVAIITGGLALMTLEYSRNKK